MDADAEVIRLRTVLRDLVALSALPAAWVGKDPAAVAAGLADTLIGLLGLEFAFVRLRDPSGAGAVTVARGNGWKTFPEWLDRHLNASGSLADRELVPDVDGDLDLHRGVVIPVGVNAEGGLVAAASDRADFPTDIDELLLSLAANHAATAYRSARLINERTRAEAELRDARNELEAKVVERTAELRRSEMYLAEAQRLTQTGSFALNAATGEPTHFSAEHYRLFGFDPDLGVPSLVEHLERIHPEDRATCADAIERAVREASVSDVEYRVVLPRHRLKHIRSIVHPTFSASGELEEFIGSAMDVTERKRAEEERQAQLWFFESMDGINRAMRGTGHLEQMLGDVLDAVLAIYGCDRAWLMYPCDPEVDSHRVLVERTRPEYPGAFALGVEIPNHPEVNAVFRSVLASDGPVRLDPETGLVPPSGPAARFDIKSMIAMAVYPKLDKPYLFGLHQCSYPRVWTPQEERLFQATGRRLADTLDALSIFHDLRESERKLEGSRSELAASRARIVTAADETRRRIERDLHDGIQQRLVSLVLGLGGIAAMTPPPSGEIKRELSVIADGLASALEELREIARGIHPAVLSEAGLVPALRALARRSAVPVTLEAHGQTRLPAPVEVAAYYVVSEALTNTAKHAHASIVHVAVEAHDSVLELSIRDDGSGGADPTRGSGLIGLADRVDALGGNIDVASAPGKGTTVLVTLPFAEGDPSIGRP
ncbi:MAG TPA: histidine kinase [Gaiellaceae bacterium]|nr:histidine kinase [Gaiellaceae bacterium]